MIARSLLAFSVALSAGCAAPTVEPPIEAATLGAELFADANLAGSQFNAFSCATCHPTGDVAPGTPGIAPSLKETAFRSSWWGGYIRDPLEAVNFCLVYFMRGDPLTRTDPSSRALYEYLVQLSPARATEPLPLTIRENVVDVPRGDADQGQIVWDNSCQVCHGAPHTGKDRISELASLVPEASIEYGLANGFDPALVVIEKVRHGQFFSVGGNMPPFPLETLDDAALGDLLAYLGI
jgi:thiosulfate dehydrogenase